MVNKKQLLIRTLFVSILISLLSTLIAYIWTYNSNDLSSIIIFYVGIISFISSVALVSLLQLIFIKLERTKAYIIASAVFLLLVSLSVWGYNF